MDAAPRTAMPPTNHFSKLIVWQLADEIRSQVLELTTVKEFDLKLRSQAVDAAHSACRNIAEGFGGTHKEFARYLRTARRSLNEVQDTMRGATVSGYVQTSDLDAIRRLLRRIYPALSRLIFYLDTTPDPPRPQGARAHRRDRDAR